MDRKIKKTADTNVLFKPILIKTVRVWINQQVPPPSTTWSCRPPCTATTWSTATAPSWWPSPWTPPPWPPPPPPAVASPTTGRSTARCEFLGFLRQLFFYSKAINYAQCLTRLIFRLKCYNLSSYYVVNKGEIYMYKIKQCLTRTWRSWREKAQVGRFGFGAKKKGKSWRISKMATFKFQDLMTQSADPNMFRSNLNERGGVSSCN